MSENDRTPAGRRREAAPSSLDGRLRSAFRTGCVSLMAREVPAEIAALIGAVPVGGLPAIMTAGTPGAVAEAVHVALGALPSVSARLGTWLSSDIGELATAFASAAGVALVGVQLAPAIDDRSLGHDGFGHDGFGHRLVTSYRGTDGSWLRPRILAFLPPEWPVPPSVCRGAGQAPGAGSLLLSIDDHGRW